MAGPGNNAKQGDGKRKSRGSVRNTDRLEAFSRGRGKGSADWATCPAERLQDVILAITYLGGAITFGLSRDEGAHSLTLLLDGSRETLWFNGGADLDDEVSAVIETLKQLE